LKGTEVVRMMVWISKIHSPFIPLEMR